MTNEERALELAHKINRRVCGIGTDTNLILAHDDEIRRECAHEACIYVESTFRTDIEYGRDHYDIDIDDLRSAIMGKE